MPNLDEMKNQASDETQNAEQQAGDTAETAETAEQKSGGKMDEVKKKMDVTGDGKFDVEDAKKMGKDAADKVKGMFNKKS